MEAINKQPWAAKSPIFKKVSEISDISALSRKGRIKYDHATRVYSDNLCIYEDSTGSGLKEVFKKDIDKGIEIGYVKKRIPLPLPKK